MDGIYRLAERTVRIRSLHEYIHDFCADYRIDENAGFERPADFEIRIHQTDIDYERAKSVRNAVREGRKPVDYADPYLETLAVYRKIAEKMPFYDTFLFHGSAVAVDGEAYLFTARSGTGKSTHTRLWREMFGSRAVMVNDDKPLVRVTEEGGTLVYGTPWDGKHRLSTNTAVPLRGAGRGYRAGCAQSPGGTPQDRGPGGKSGLTGCRIIRTRQEKTRRRTLSYAAGQKPQADSFVHCTGQKPQADSFVHCTGQKPHVQQQHYSTKSLRCTAFGAGPGMEGSREQSVSP